MVCPKVEANDCASKALVKGECGCKECAKSAGEYCGGDSKDTEGKCGGSLTCIKPPRSRPGQHGVCSCRIFSGWGKIAAMRPSERCPRKVKSGRCPRRSNEVRRRLCRDD